MPVSTSVSVAVRDDHHRFEAAQETVRAPVLGQLHGRPHELPGILLELRLEPLEQGKRVRGRARESRR